MKVLTFRNKKEAAKKAGEIVSNLLDKKPNATLGLATGETMIPFYKRLTKLYKRGKLDFSKVTTFNLDEYAGLTNLSKNKNSYHYYMDKNLFSKINLKKNSIHFPSSSTSDYDKQIKKAGGIDLCILGIGENGHIAFNEPGSSFKGKTRKVKLTQNTLNVNSRFFKSQSEVPREAYTMGISTIMSSKKIILLAFGDKKSPAIKKTVSGKISENVPASVLRKHKDATLILDSRASSLLSRRDASVSRAQ